MKKTYFFKGLFMLVLGINIQAAQAQNFNLVDINKIKNSNPANDQYAALNMFAELNGVFYFSADDGIHGTELWSSDGTRAGTQLVKDINPGTASSSPGDITVSGGRIYFTAIVNNIQQLWTSDGTAGGTKRLADLFVEGPSTYPNPNYLTDVNGTLYFFNAYSNFNVSPYSIIQLWKSDGTEAGTTMITDLVSQFNVDYVRYLVNVNGRLFFVLYDGDLGTELYTSDGTAEGTTMVTDINPNPFAGSYPSHLTVLNGLLYFSADDGAGGKLWISDGTAEGTHAANNINNINTPIDYYIFEPLQPFAVKNNVLFFQGSTADLGYELASYDPSNTNNNVKIVKDISPGLNSSYPSFITNVNNTLFFTIGPAGEDAELWKSDGTETGTVLVKDINPGGENFYSNLININSTLFFTYGDNVLGTELWKSDGTGAGTTLVKDILPGPLSSFPQYLTYKNANFIFSATDGKKGTELWKSDGSEAGTTIVKNINETATSSSYPYGFVAAANNKVTFSAYDGNEYDVFATDGSDAGTKPISLSGYSNPVKFKNEIWFLGDSARLWKTNGTKAGTSVLPIPGFVDYSTGYITDIIATETSIYIVTFDFTTNMQTLWRTDGTTAGTYIIKSDFGSFDLYPAVIGNTLFFSSYANANGELWKSDGTVAGTTLVKQITAPFTYTPVLNLTNYNGKLYFVASNSYYGASSDFIYTFWTSDGTEAGTKIVKPVSIFVDFSTNTLFAQGNGKLFFYALNPITKGYELFASDGTASGTRLVKDINKGPTSSSVNSLISGDTLVYFVADDGKHGLELWKSNGTKAGTRLVKDISAGINSSSLMNMVNAPHDKLFFTINDTLWQSDGTKKNTHPVEDPALKGVSQIGSLTVVGDQLYFSGYTYAAGLELYVGNTLGALCPCINDY